VKTVTADKYLRIRISDLKPGAKYACKSLGNGRFELAEVEECGVPLVKARKVNGRWMGTDAVRLDRGAIVESIRQDRER